MLDEKLPSKISPDKLHEILMSDKDKIFSQTKDFLSATYPSYEVDNKYAAENIEADSQTILKNMSFFKIASCTIEKTDDVADFFHQKMRKLLAAAYSSGNKVCFGFIGRKDSISLILGIDPCMSAENAQSVKDIAQGILPGILLEDYKIKSYITPSWWGMMEAIPSSKIEGEKQKIDYTGLLRSLNGREFNFFIMARPIPAEIIQGKISSLLKVQTECSKLLKRNISLQSGTSDTRGTTKTIGDTTTKGFNVSGAPLGAAIGAGIGFAVANAPGALGGALLGATIGSGFGFNYSKSHSESVAKNISSTVSSNTSVSFDAQNYFAKELMEYAEEAVSRFKLALISGGWDTVVSYSAKDSVTLNLIQGYLFSDIAKLDKKKLPARIQTLSQELFLSDFCKNGESLLKNCELLIPKSFWNKDYRENKISSPLNSDELGMLFAFPESSAPGFELREGKFYSLSAEHSTNDKCVIGNICDGEHIVANAPFSLSKKDINKHTFVCGITGCGKTNSVKKILQEAHVPFLILECAKKEYRNIDTCDLTIFTPGHPEIRSPQFNPFYIQQGISLQIHIDYLKDLFNASFAFYGPMTYILETCLHRIYQKKGWNLTTGDHPLLVKTDSIIDRYDVEYVKQQYGIFEHRFIFPTMRDLLEEVKNYIENELTYDSEVSGNIKSAMLARLEGLCIGAKGYMFDTIEPVQMANMLSQNTVFELEGLSDDSDKAFAVGLLIIFVNEYRQIQSEASELKHILVIEEAHRLLKNIPTDRSSENMGNPKGKAVEHFTNMLAEMRSYGQAVIIAEQIPSKIAPDVIKNSSNKIIHRLVSRDDQEFMANTIGIKSEDAIYLGTQKTGFALCHKEGMYTPVSVKMDMVKNKKCSDQNIREKAIAEQNVVQGLLSHQIKNMLSSDINTFVFRLLNSLLALSIEQRRATVLNEDELSRICKIVREKRDNIVNDCIVRKIEKNANSIKKAVARVLAEKTVTLFCSEAYCADRIPQNILTLFSEFYEEPAALKTIDQPRKITLRVIEDLLEKLSESDKYGNLVYELVSNLAIKAYLETETNIADFNRRKLLESYFILPNEQCITAITERICERYSRKKVL